MPTIHPTSIIGPDVSLADDVEIGPFCVLSGKVTLGAGVKVLGHVQMSGPVVVGAGTMIYSGTCLGFPPQDFKFKIGDVTAGVVIGEKCLLREHVTVHAATRTDVPTRVGNNVMMMVNAHAGHDARVGNNVIMANGALLGGHSQVHDNVIMSGNAAIHQFVRIGRLGFLSGCCGTSVDIPPFCVVAARNVMTTVNLVGLRRSGAPREHVTAVREAFWHVFRRNLSKPDMLRELYARGKDCPLVHEQAVFVEECKRGICRAARLSEVEAAGE